jgi:hypothetical protein
VAKCYGFELNLHAVPISAVCSVACLEVGYFHFAPPSFSILLIMSNLQPIIPATNGIANILSVV